MKKKIIALIFILIPGSLTAQKSLRTLLMDSLMVHASVSISIIDASDSRIIVDYNGEKSMVPASVMKLVTSAVALELLGPSYSFKTEIEYNGNLDRKTGILKGSIVLKGGGDPALGSDYFSEHYGKFIDNWISAILNLGIKKVSGGVISDDSYFDYQPVPPKWLWEDIGNYYGAGAYGLSVFDNTYLIHLKSSEASSEPVITGIIPEEAEVRLTNGLFAYGVNDSGYVYSAPYSSSGWISGSIPPGVNDFKLKASINDPPLLLAKMIKTRLETAGIIVEGDPTTCRIENDTLNKSQVVILLTTSPPLSKIIEVLNHESVNLYAEHLVKELGKVFGSSGSTSAGIKVIEKFLEDSVGLKPGGIIMTDGSGLSPADAIDSKDLSLLLLYMKKKGRYFNEYYTSLPEAGKDGTLKNRFKDPVFYSSLRAKSGSMTRVRSYAGYLTAKSDNTLIFSIIVNNFNGPSQVLINAIEDILRETAIEN